MKKAIILILATVLATSALWYFALSPKRIPHTARLILESPDREFAAVVTTNDLGVRETRLVVQSVHIVRSDKLGPGSTLKPGVKLGLNINTVASIHSCENSGIEVRWIGATKLLVRYFQTKPDWVSSVKTADGISVSLEEMPIAADPRSTSPSPRG